MTVNKSVTHWSKSVHGQPNTNHPQAKQRVNWANGQKASTNNYTVQPQGSTTSAYDTHEKYGIRKCWTLAASDFGFDIPDCAYIKNITFVARIKISGTINVKAPNARFNIYKGTKPVETYQEDDTGWDDGIWYFNPNKKLSNSWQDISYTMSGTEFRRRGIPVSQLNEKIMGIDLRFYNAKDQNKKTHTVSVQFVKCTIDYELADQSVTFDRATSENNPRVTTAGTSYTITATYKNKSNAGCCDGTDKEINIAIPKNATATSTNNRYSNGVWTVPCTPNASDTLKLNIVNYSIGEDNIKFSSSGVGAFDYWVYSGASYNDVGTVTPYPKTIQKGVNSCITFKSKVLASDGVATYNINMDTVNNTNPQVNWTLDTQIDGLEIDTEQTTDTKVVLNVPSTTDGFDVSFTGCFIPNFTGPSNVSANLDGGTDVVRPYVSQEPPIFVVRNNAETKEDDITTAELVLKPSKLTFVTHRVATSTEIEAYIIDCSVADFDSNMVIDDCTLTANMWEKVNYIGCVPLPFAHFDPKSTYENKEINESYKNKTYMGKEGVIDENITLNFRVPPRDVTTLQGLVKLDKPTPINASWKCFEGDVLNHRGWTVFSKIEAEKTNPLYYKCEATVTYITHDIHTKFQIFKKNKVNSVAMPELLEDTVELGSNLSYELDMFDIDTDGGFIYDDDSDDGAKNLFSLDEAQHLTIKTKKVLSDVSKVRFDWYCNKIDELRENKVERIFRLYDKNNAPVLEYEYSDFNFEEEYVTCTVTIRVRNKVGGWDIKSIENVDLKTELEADPIAEGYDEVVDVDIIDDDTPIYNEDDSTEYTGEEPAEEDTTEQGYIAPDFNPNDYDITLVYGSSLEFVLNKNQLTINDAGYNGREVSESFELILGNNYYFESYWENKNQDGNTDNIITYIDIGIMESMLSSTYSEYYGNLMVSPFPIPYKTIVFTRESEEGTIYYLTGDEPFKYMLEPYYQYHCGCDLVTRDGISIFDLNNSYTHFYIENGLVRLGFNKYNGRLYLAKWDIISKEWITTNYFHMPDGTKFALQSYSDDKIVIKGGANTYFTIWRGHPFIAVTNPSSSIDIDTNFAYAYSDLIDGVAYPFPLIADFMNTYNKLPDCIGGQVLDEDCITLEDDDITDGTNHTLTLTVPETVNAEDDTTLTASLDPSTSDGEVVFFINDEEVETVSSPFSLTYQFEKAGTYHIQAVYTGDEDDNIAISPKYTVIVQAPTPRQNTPAYNPPQSPSQSGLPAGQYTLTAVASPSKTWTYKDGSQVIMQLKKGNIGIKGLIIEVQVPDGRTVTKSTGDNGIVIFENKGEHAVDYVPDKYQIGARFYDTGRSDSGKLICSAFVNVTIEKATPTFKSNAVDGKIQKGNSLKIKLNGVEGGLKDKKITYKINGGSKKTKTTNQYGNIHMLFNKKGDYQIKLLFAGSTRYAAKKKTFNIKVI